jgi:hypothetical protein
MKKLAYTIFLICLISLSGCRSEDFTAVSRTVKFVSNCFNSLNLAQNKLQNNLPGQSVKTGKKKAFSSYLPHYSWDSKMMLR